MIVSGPDEFEDRRSVRRRSWESTVSHGGLANALSASVSPAVPLAIVAPVFLAIVPSIFPAIVASVFLTIVTAVLAGSFGDRDGWQRQH